jgi:site-specific DNA recombinase
MSSPLRFAFYGRVSTEDMQDPTSSKQWQRSRADALIESVGGVVVAEYFDIGQSRSLPWKRRPEALSLLDAIRQADRGFDAVVIGEPARAFSGNQFAMTYPVLVHHKVELWVPEVGGKIEPDSDAHDLIMNLYGGMSKAERRRIQLRVRTAMVSQTQHEGRWLGGRPPYGYLLADAGPHPNPSKAADGKRLRRLEIDPVAAPIVQRIFDEYLTGKGYLNIAQGLTRDGVPSPSAHDPARNRHRDQRSWAKIAVREILRNPRYTGRMVWNRVGGSEVLLDEDDVAAGYQSRRRPNDPSDWVWSSELTHEAIIDSETFDKVRAEFAAGAYRPSTGKTRTTKRTYVLSGRVHCDLCDHSMAGNFVKGDLRYRCRFPYDRAAIPGVDHPHSISVREDQIVPRIDEWLATLFDPENLEATCRELAMAGGVADADRARMEAAERKLSDCDQRMAKYRHLLDTDGADVVLVAGWMSEVQGERLKAEREIAAAQPSEKLTPKQARSLVQGLDGMAAALAAADPKLKQQLYEQLGIHVRYHHETRLVRVDAKPCWATVRVGGGT